MRKIWKNMKNSLLFYTVISIIIFYFIHFCLNIFNIQFRQWVYWIMLLISIIGLVLGLIQVLRKRSRKVKIIVSIIGIIILCVLVTFWQMILLVFAFLYNPEHVITKDDKEYVASVRSFLDVNVVYYDYINVFLVGNKVKIKEYYGNGGYDPFDKKNDNIQPIEYYYYDNNGKIIKTNSEYYNKNLLNNSTDKDKETNIITDSSSTNEIKENQNNKDNENILYEKKINDQIIIRVMYRDSILGQRSIISIVKTIDGGITWNEQIESGDGFIQIHNGAKFVFIDENIGFINDLGMAGTNGDNRELLVTTDGGKNFYKATINSSEEDLYIDDIPYIENETLKLKAYKIKNSEKVYYYFYSQNNGETWKQM